MRMQAGAIAKAKMTDVVLFADEFINCCCTAVAMKVDGFGS